jgi:hypothetical protein
MRSVSTQDQASVDERTEALSDLHKTYAPTSESGLILPMSQLADIVAEVKADLYAMELAKSNVVPFPSLRAKEKARGMQSVYLDDLQLSVIGEYYERPSALSYDSMRMMVDQTPVLNAVIMTRVRQVQRFCRVQESGEGPGFVIRHIERDHQATAAEQESIQLLQRFFSNCGWETNPRKRRKMRRDAFSQFMGKSVRDSLALDSAPIETEFKRDKSLGIDGFYAVDGATIRLCTEEGYRGDDEIIALQVVQGNIRTAYDLDSLIYEARNPRSDVTLAGYGLSEVELLVRIVTGFLNALTLNIRGFSENAIPRGVLNLTGSYSDSDLIAFRRYWNSMVKGINNAWTLPVMVSKDPQSKAQFEQFGQGFDEMYFSKWMTFLTSIICAVYGMSPDEINFESFAASRSSLSGADTAEKLADSKDKGLRPLLSYYENLFTDYVLSTFDDKYCFRWTGLDEEDEDKRHEMRKLVLTVDEARAQEGYDAHPDKDMGAAPLNPSLTGLYMQKMQGEQQDFGTPPGEDEGARSEEGEPDDRQADEPGGQDGEEDDKGGDPQDEQEQEADAPMQKSEALDFGVRSSPVYRLGDAV